MATQLPLVFVTGISGSVGSHVASHLMNSGYSVRGTARSGKLEILRASPALRSKNIEVVQVENIATDDLSPILNGVKAIIHDASPLAGREPAQQAFSSAVEGTLNVLQEAKRAGITKVVVTSSWGTTLDPSLKQTYEGKVFTPSDWGSATKEEVLTSQESPLWIYLSIKILAEKAVWKFARENPEMDIATINPPFIYGPTAPGFPLPSNRVALGTNNMIYRLISGPPDRPLPPQLPPFFCDVRDVARAHVAALTVPPKKENKRYIMSGGAFTWQDAVQYLRETIPDIAPRLPSIANAPTLPGKLSSIDSRVAQEDLGIGEFIPWKTTLVDAVTALIEIEKTWAPNLL